MMHFCNKDLCAGPDEMPHYVAFHLDLQCLPKYLHMFAGIQNEKGYDQNFLFV